VTATKRKRPWHMFYPLLLVIVLGIGWSIYWLFAFNGMKDALAQARVDLSAQGSTLACERETWGGYPFRIELTCENAGVSTQGRKVKAARVFAVMMAYDLSHVLAEVEGPTRIDDVEIAHAPARLSFDAHRAGGFDASAEVPEAAAAGVSAKQLRALARSKGGTLDFAADAQELIGQGVTLKQIQLVGSTPAAILEAPDPLAEAARSGQALDITKAEATAGDVVLSATGQLRIDPARRLAGKVTAEVSDIDKFLGVAAPLLRLDDGTRAGLASMLAILAKDSASKRRSADLIAKDGELYFGPFKLAQLPPID
jgi:hypothetical protein